jgi:O-antigen ligase
LRIGTVSGTSTLDLTPETRMMTKTDLSRNLVLVTSAALLPLAVVGGPSVAVSLALLAVASLLGSGTPWPAGSLRLSPLLLVWLACLAWAAATALWSLSPSESLLRLAKLAWILAAAWILLRVQAEAVVPAPRRLFSALVLGTVVAAALVAVERASTGWFFEALGLHQPHPDPDIEATRVFKGIGILVVVSWCLVPRLLARYGRSLCLAGGAALGGLVLWAANLSITLAFGAAVLAYLLSWVFGGRFPAVLRLLVVSLVLLLPAAGLFRAAPFVDAVSAAESAGLTVPGSGLHRAYIYDFVLERIWQRPLVGWGLESSSLLPGSEHVVPALQRRLLPSHPHNAVLEIWVELGAVGAGLAAALLWLCLRSIEGRITGRPERAAALAAFTAFFSISMLSFSLWATWWLSTAVVASFLFQVLAGGAGPGREPAKAAG